MNESCHTWMRHVPCEWVMAHAMHESCHVCGETRSWLIHIRRDSIICDMIHSCVACRNHVWHDSYLYVTWLIHVWHVSIMWHNSFVCDMTHSCVTCHSWMWSRMNKWATTYDSLRELRRNEWDHIWMWFHMNIHTWSSRRYSYGIPFICDLIHVGSLSYRRKSRNESYAITHLHVIISYEVIHGVTHSEKLIWCHTWWVMSHVTESSCHAWLRHVKHECVMSHMNESCHINETQMNEITHVISFTSTYILLHLECHFFIHMGSHSYVISSMCDLIHIDIQPIAFGVSFLHFQISFDDLVP